MVLALGKFVLINVITISLQTVVFYLGPHPPHAGSELLSVNRLISTSICSFGFSLTILPISIDAYISAVDAPAARAAL
jgi:hypothetical protein